MGRSARIARVVLDLAVASGFFWLACSAAEAWLWPAPGLAGTCAILALGYGLVLVLVFALLGLNKNPGTLLNIGELAGVMRGLALTAAVYMAVLFLVGVPQGKGPALMGIVFASGAVLVERRLVASLQKRFQLSGRVGRRVLLYGCGSTGTRLMKKIVQAPTLGCTVVGFLDDFATIGSPVACRVSQASEDLVEVRVLGRLQDLAEVVRARGVDELLITIPHHTPWKLSQLLEVAQGLGIKVGIVPRLGAFRADQLQVEDISGIPILRPFAFDRRGAYPVLKRLIDVSVSVASLAILGPVWAVAAVLIRIDSPGPVIFRQQRVGLGGRVFDMYKFRTMYVDAEKYARAPASHDDPRITRVGRWIRTAGFDETPQLLNILQGDMSLVGPRPEMPFIVRDYGELERQRLLALPGLTGLWQLSADRSSEIHENIEYDLYYVQNRSTLLDIAILVETLFFSFSVLLHRLFRIDSLLLVEDHSVAKKPSEALRRRNKEARFVLAALDQRMNGELPESWQRVLPALYELSGEVPIKVLVAERNVAFLDEFLGAFTSDPDQSPEWRPEYVPHSSRSDLHRLSRQAALVITDLPEVASWARDGMDVLMIDGDRELRSADPSGADESELMQAVRAALATAGPPRQKVSLDLALGS